MIHGIVFTLLFAVTLALFAAPFIPAFIELRRTSRLVPLNIPADYDGDVRHFARRFREFVASERPKQPGESTAEYNARSVSALRAFIAPAPLVVDRGSVLPGDVYAKTSLFGWDGAVYRGVLADESVALGRESLVLRWIHAAKNLRIGSSSALLGRASAEAVLRVDNGTVFGWLSAPRIEFGDVPTPRRTLRGVSARALASSKPTLPRCVQGDLTVPPNSDVLEDLMVSGSLRIGAGSVVRRSVKSKGPMTIEHNVWVRGSVVSNSDVTIDADCAIGGIVVAERAVTIGHRTRIGSEDALSTVSAPEISVAPGAVAHGTVWARERGRVTDRA